jgi:hypothetical protein
VPPSAFGSACGAGQCCTALGGAPRPPDTAGGDCRLVFQAYDGKGLGDSIVTAIAAISVGTSYDVTTIVSSDPTNMPDATGAPIDATKFLSPVRAMDEGDTKNGCPAHAARDTDGDGIKDTFDTVVVGTPVCFEITPKTNTTLPATDALQWFVAFVDVVGEPGGIELDRRNVLFLVPPK